MNTPEKFLARALAFAACLVLCNLAFGQSWPAKPVRFVVPWPPGADLIGRIIAKKLQENLKQPFEVDMVGGSNSVTGTAALAKAAPDGYTMMLNRVAVMAINEAHYTDLPYSLQKDLAPVTKVSWSTYVLVAHPAAPAKTLGELVALAKSKPGDVQLASSGTVTTEHLSGELLNLLAGIKLQHVPYRGADFALKDALAGHVPFALTAVLPAMPHIRSGKLRALAVTSARRTSRLRDVPAFGETLRGFEVALHSAIWVPVGTPRDLVMRINSEIARVLRAPELREVLQLLGAEDVAPSTPEELDQLVRAEIQLWNKVMKSAGIQPEPLK